MTQGTRSVCVHVIAPNNGEAEFLFPHAELRVDSGVLFVHSESDDKSMLMTFSPGSWKAAWRVDPETGKPLGLADVSWRPESKTELPRSEPPSSLESSASPLTKSIAEALHSTPYEGLPLFSKIIGAAEHEVEQAISSGISLGIIKPEWVALLPIQAELSHCLPPILSQRPKKLHDILTQVKQAGQSPACDSIQLRVWLKQNPQKR